jgi:NADPH-dependent 2,4-dienoyl-CoA reductase/sulfur reductase-like enzyme
MIEAFDVAVVGAGPAGLSAAGEAARCGARVVIIDDNSEPGGQYFRHPPPALSAGGTGLSAGDRSRRDALLRALRHPAVDYRANATVWDLPEPLMLAVAHGARSGRIRARAIVLATGARDRAVPFPGWTLPGVMSAGGLQNLIKGMRIAPPGPVVVAGNGPLLLVAAASLVSAGVRIAAIVESAHASSRALGLAPQLALAPGIVKLAAGYYLKLARAGVRRLSGHCVIRATGTGELEEVVVARIDAAGGIARTGHERIAARTLVTGFGLLPSLELYRLIAAGEAPVSAAPLAAVERDDRLMTAVPGVFAAGDGAGIGGVELALVEGRIAGIEAARFAGANVPHNARILALLRFQKARLDRFRKAIEQVFAPPVTWQGLLTEETIVCRCEDVRLLDVRRCIAEGAATPVQLKHATRIGMGRCQGRYCSHTLAELARNRDGAARITGPAPLPRARPPARPIRLGDLLHEDIPPPALPDDPHLPRRR